MIGTSYDVIAPDGSEIRSGLTLGGGSMVHCTLLPGGITQAVKHKTVEEVWYFIQGYGQVWRAEGEFSETVDVRPGTFLTIPLGTHFQFRNIGDEALVFIICTMPPWPGPDEAVPVQGNAEWE
jgi:mannose-6-phosphate isomerase-like protein (cupin superfamily)